MDRVSWIVISERLLWVGNKRSLRILSLLAVYTRDRSDGLVVFSVRILSDDAEDAKELYDTAAFNLDQHIHIGWDKKPAYLQRLLS